MSGNDVVLELEGFISDIVFCGIANIDISVIDRLVLIKDNLMGFYYLNELIDDFILSIKCSDKIGIINNITKIDFYIKSYIAYNN